MVARHVAYGHVRPARRLVAARPLARPRVRADRQRSDPVALERGVPRRRRRDVMSPYDGKERYPVANPILWGSSGGLTRAGATQALDLSVPFLPDSAAVVDLQNGVMTRIWLEFHRRVVGTLTNMALAVSTIPNATSGTIAQQPTGLGPTQAGLIYNVLPPYAHVMRWNGTAWEFAPGDHGSGHIIPYLVLPGNPTCW